MDTLITADEAFDRARILHHRISPVARLHRDAAGRPSETETECRCLAPDRRHF